MVDKQLEVWCIYSKWKTYQKNMMKEL
jgi:hypothetical protein